MSTDPLFESLSVIFNRSASFMALTVGPQHVFQLANPMLYEMLNLDSSILGRSVRSVFPELVAQGVVENLDKVYATGEPFRADEAPLTFATPEGGKRTLYVDVVYQPVRDEKGQVFGIVHQGSNATSRVRARGAIQNERENFRNLFQQTPEMVCILRGPEHVFEFVNEAHIRALGFDATGKTVREAQPDSVPLHGILDTIYRTGDNVELKEIEVSVSNRHRFFNLTYAARRDPSGAINGVMVLGTEITDQVLARQTLKTSQAHLEAAVQARDEFMSVASHELKTPLTTLKLHHQLFRRILKKVGDGEVPKPEVERLVQQSERQMTRLTRLVEDMLDIARIQSGKLTVTRERVGLSDLVRDVVGRLDPILRQEDIAPELVCEENIEGSFDAFRIEQVVTNLLTNAMRYGEHRPVQVSLAKHGQKALITVKDLGRGIEASAQKRIFDRFERSISPHDVNGLGLGLYITRQIVEAHDGRVWVESEGLGKGSTFFVELPLEG